MFEGRLTPLKKIKGVVFTNPKYPVCLINDSSPYDEKIMSMPSIISKGQHQNSSINKICIPHHKGNFFFFIYNLENYFHFLYDTLPYLYFYFVLKGIYPDLKLLVSPFHKWLPFQRETFELLGIQESDFQIVEEGEVYERVFVPPSLTHGGYSNSPPAAAAFGIWQRLIEAVGSCSAATNLPKKFYVSRRSWVHGQLENIGTNYTARRRCENEDEFVGWLTEKGVKEVFCETMSMRDKISLFTQAEEIWGFAGGGMVNCLFCPPNTLTFCIDTPDFLKINHRFLFSVARTNSTVIYDHANHSQHGGPWPLYTRVKEIASGRIGEIEYWNEESKTYSVNLSNNDVAGFSAGAEFEKKNLFPSEVEALDGGLNSPFLIHLTGLKLLFDTSIRNENNNSNERGGLSISRSRL
jgi:capsular polysaccharide biosynthesis protein